MVVTVDGVTDWELQPGAGPVFVGGFHVTDFGVPVPSGWYWIITPTGIYPAAANPNWSNTTVVRSGKTGFLCMAGTPNPLVEGRYWIHIKYTNGSGDTDIVRCGRITVPGPTA